MKVLIIGGGGMLGHKLVQIFDKKVDVWATIRNGFEDYKAYKIFNQEKIIENVNVEQIKSIEKVIEKIRPEVVINAVGVIKQIPTAKDVIGTLSINSIFPHQLLELSRKFDFRLICISTDCVFSGKTGNYTETDLPDAHDLYGRSKQLGEIIAENCLTLRTSIVGRELKTAHSLVEWFFTQQGKSVRGFKNAVFSGFPTIILAEILLDIIENYPKLKGLYHVSSEPINKFDLLHLIKSAYQIEIEIELFEDFVIDRSLDSTKFREAIDFKPLDWHQMIERMAEDNALY